MSGHDLLKILVVHGAGDSNFPSGEQQVIESERLFLESEGHVVKVLLENSAFSKNPLSIFWSFSKRKWLRNAINSFQPNIIHFHSVIPYLGLSVLMEANSWGVPIVQTLHNGHWLCVEGGFYREGHYCNNCVGSLGWKGVINGCGRGYLAAIFLFVVNLAARSGNRLFQWVDQFIAVSEYVSNQYVNSGFPSSKIIVNSNSVDLNQIDRLLFSKPWSARSGVVFAGRVSIAKGADVLKYLIPKLTCPIHVVGDGPELDHLQIYCLNNGFNHVIFWGKQSHEKTLEILGEAVCSIIPSQCGETFSLVAAESMALGTPVIASKLGGVADLVKMGGGVVVAAEDNDAFLHEINEYILFPLKAEKVGKQGRKYVCDNLLSQQRGKNLLKIYKNLLQENIC